MAHEMIDGIFREAKGGGALSGPERVFDALGMGSGPYAPALRMATGAAAGGLVAYAIKPDWAFTASGEPRPWSFTQEGADNPAEATSVPWWVMPAAGAFVCGMIV